jgi:hypothetical protein
MPEKIAQRETSTLLRTKYYSVNKMTEDEMRGYVTGMEKIFVKYFGVKI